MFCPFLSFSTLVASFGIYTSSWYLFDDILLTLMGTNVPFMVSPGKYIVAVIFKFYSFPNKLMGKFTTVFK